MRTPSITSQQAELSGKTGKGALQRYKELVCAGGGWGYFILFEVGTFFGKLLPGIAGFAFRSYLYKFLSPTGNKPFLGWGVDIRNPKCIRFGKNCMLDEHVAIDPRGEKSLISLGDYAAVGRHTSVVAKNAEIHLSSGVNVGSHCRIATQSKIEIGESTLIAAYCYIGPGNHQMDENDSRPLIEREMEIKGGVKIGKHVWIGTRCTILDGVTIGDGAIIGAHSLVKDDIPPGAVAFGTPAKIVKNQVTNV